MKYVDLKKHLLENGVAPVYLFEGEEGYFRNNGEKLVCAPLRLDKTLDYASLDGSILKGDKIKTLLSSVCAFPFLSEKRVVKVTEFYPTEAEYEKYLKELFENPPQSSVLLIVNRAKAKKEQAKLSSKPNVTVVDCSKSDEETVKKWIFLTAKNAGVYIDPVTCGKIAGYCSIDMARISSETEKLLTYAQAKGLNRISDQVVDEIVYPDSEYKLYELSGALSVKNYSAFVTITEELQSKGFDELSLLSSLCYHFKSLHECSVFLGNDKQTADALGMKEYAVKKSREQARKLGKDKPKEYYAYLYRTRSDIKSGVYTPSSALKKVTARLFFGD